MSLLAFALLAQALGVDPDVCQAARVRTDLSAFARDQACVVLQPERVFQGVFFDDFEGQVFVEGATHASDARPGPSTWLHLDLSRAARSRWRMAGQMCGHAYRLRFTGADSVPLPPDRAAVPPRPPVFPTGYGHLGAFERLVSVNRILAVTDLGERYHACGSPRTTGSNPLIYP